MNPTNRHAKETGVLAADRTRKPDDLPPVYETPTVATYLAHDLEKIALRVNAGSDMPFQ